MTNIKNGITLLHPTDDYKVSTEFKGDDVINTVNYSDGTIVIQTIDKEGSMHVHVPNRDIEYSGDGKTAWVKK